MLPFLVFKIWLVHFLFDVTSWCFTPPWPGKHYSWWRRDVNFPNTEFQSFLSRSTMRLSSECNQICSSTSQCQFATFNNFTRECKTYAVLNGPVHVTNTSLWKAYLQIDTWPYAHFGHIRWSFTQANKFCTDFGGHLALPDTDAEIRKIKQILGQKQGVSDCWIGGMKSENGWELLDGRPINIHSKLWAPGQPDSSGGVCVQLWKKHNYMFDDAKCSYQKQVICEFK